MSRVLEEVLVLVRAKVRALIAESQGRAEADIAAGDDEPLTTGLLDSAATLELVLWIEANFLRPGAELDMTAANFGSIAKIAAAILAAQEGLARAAA